MVNNVKVNLIKSEEPQNELIYYIGGVFESSSCTYMLCQTDYSKIALISLVNGNRLEDPIEVNLSTKFSDREVSEFLYTLFDLYEDEDEEFEYFTYLGKTEIIINQIKA